MQNKMKTAHSIMKSVYIIKSMQHITNNVYFRRKSVTQMRQVVLRNRKSAIGNEHRQTLNNEHSLNKKCAPNVREKIHMKQIQQASCKKN